MFSRDYLADLGLKGGIGADKGTENNAIVEYVIDDTSQPIKATDLLSFVGNKVIKETGGSNLRCMALESGNVGDSIKCQITGVVRQLNGFEIGGNYYDNGGSLSTVVSDKYIGLAITKDELLLKGGVFIYD